MSSFAVNDIEELLALMEHWGIGEMHLSIQDASVDLVRLSPPASGMEVSAAPLEVAGQPVHPELQCTPELLTIYAPAVGVFHLARHRFPHGVPQPGDPVQAGQIIGAIELMHVPYDLVSPVSGTIEAMLAEDGAGVEYGQPLMVICPDEEVSEDEAGMSPPPPR